MKKFAAALAAAIAFTSLSAAIPVNAAKYTIDQIPSKATVKINGVKKLTLVNKVSVYDSNTGKYVTKNKKVQGKFKSSNASVASVSSDGIVRAHKLGKAKITVKYGGTTKKMQVTVQKKKTIYIAHRGAEDIAPECTMAALKKGIEVGYKQMECDFWFDKDGDLIVFHDKNMERLTGKDMLIEDLTEVLRKKLPIIGGNNVSYYPQQYIPKAQTVFKLIRNNPGITLTMHLKTKLTDKHAAKISKMLKKYGIEDRVVLLSEKVNNLYVFDGMGYKRAYLCKWKDENHLLRVVDWAVKNKIEIIYYKYYSDFLPPSSFILKAHENNIAIHTFSLNKPEQYELMTNLGINAVICNKIFFKYDPTLNPAYVAPTEPPTETDPEPSSQPETEASTEPATEGDDIPLFILDNI